MSFTSSSHGNTKTTEIKPHILHNRMPPQIQQQMQQMQLAGCTHSSTVMTEAAPGAPGETEEQKLGYHFGYGYNHIYPYLGGLGPYSAFGYGYGYPYRGSCCYRGYPWRYF